MSNVKCPTISSVCLCLLLVMTGTGAKQCAREEEVRCMVNPCKLSDCPAVPEATCQANYCGGCNAEFYVNGVQLQSVDCVMDKLSHQRAKSPVFGSPPPGFPENLPARPPLDLPNDPVFQSRPRILKDDTENEQSGIGGRNPPPPRRRSGSRDGQSRGNGPNLRPNLPPFRGIGRGRPSSQSSSLDPSISIPPPPRRQRPNSQSGPARRSQPSSNRRPSWLRNFFRGIFRRYRN